jgi:threonine/homoserine/homoserine lactone efflux protein
MSFRSTKSTPKKTTEDKMLMTIETPSMSPATAIKSGFLTNVLNPKATLFILAVFTQVITPATPKWIQLGYGAEMVVATAVWFSIVSFFLSTDFISRKIQSSKGIIEKVTGVVLTALGIKILLGPAQVFHLE